MKKKIALIFGVTGQDGAYLSKLLLKKGYKVHGVKRRSSSLNTYRIDDIYKEPFAKKNNFVLHYGDVTDSLSVFNIIKKIKPNEIYNLAAQSHVAVSFEIPEYTTNADALGTLRILESIVKLNRKIKFYQAGSSEMFGKVYETPQTEKTPFYPRSPYGVAKLYSHWITINYRESYKIFASNGILFNHESPLRGETFVTKKVVKALCNIKHNKQKKLYIGNLYSKRDWGHAQDYVKAMWKILQHKQPDDFVICTGKQYTIKQFINLVAQELNMKIKWKGKGIKEKAYNEKNRCIIECKRKYLRPAEVDTLKGNFSKAKKLLKWKPENDIKSLIKDMVNYELNSILR
jgi:GDPmannose 4,6-dehydratase